MATAQGQAPDRPTTSVNRAAGSSLLSATQAPLGQADDRPVYDTQQQRDAGSIGLHGRSWRDIFKSTIKGPPTLGLDFLRASKDTTTVRYNLQAPREGPWKYDHDEDHSSYATLTLLQDLGKLGLGAVVWDCVSVISLKSNFVYLRHKLVVSAVW